MEKCVLCEAKATINEQDKASRTIYNCQNCGVFVVSDVVQQDVKKYGCKLAAYFTYRRLAGHSEVILLTYDKAKKDKDYLQLTVEQVLANYPNTFTELMDTVLLNLSRMSPYEGAEIKVESLEMSPVFCVKKISYDALSFIIKSMQKFELLEVNYYSSSFFPCGVIVSPKGWDRIADIQEGKTTRDYALILDADRNDRKSESFRTAATKAVKECGYHAVDSTLSSDNGRINHKLIALLKGCSFVISDFSISGGAVHYAAGMASVLGKTNILTCHSESRRDMELDQEQFSILGWDDEKELQLQLVNAIQALLK